MENQIKTKKDRKDLVLLHATALFLEKGINDIFMTDIAKSAGLGVASVYRYFGTKQNLVIEVAINIWDSVIKEFEGIYDNSEYKEKKGIDQVRSLFSIFPILISKKPKFFSFNYDFDRYVITEKLNFQSLEEYERKVLNSYEIFTMAVEKGRSDGSVSKEFPVYKTYLAFTHALLSVSQKLSGPNVLSSDDFSHFDDEIEILIDSFINYIKE